MDDVVLNILPPKNHDGQETPAHTQAMWNRANIAARRNKVSALLLSWENTYDDLHTESEVLALASVFRFNYHFTVEQRKIHTRKRPLIQVNKHLADFIYNHDDKDTLLIVYYAGHGSVDAFSGALRLLGNTQCLSRTDAIVWNEAERVLHDSHADVLEIIDCCHAGSLRPKSGRGERCHELLAACASDEYTRSPGPASFTSALIWALENLKKRDHFDTSELCHKLSSAPNLAQTPQLLRAPGNNARPIILGPCISSIEPDLSSRLLGNIERLHDHVNRAYSSIGWLSRDIIQFIKGEQNQVVTYRSLETGDSGPHQRHIFAAHVDGNDSSPAYTLPSSHSGNEDGAHRTPSSTPVDRPGVSVSRTSRFLSGLFKRGRASNLVKDKTTVLFTTTSLLIISTAFTIRAYFKPRSPNCTSIPAIDDNFYSTLSEMAINICSIYLTIVPLLRSRSLRNGYRFWYRFCLTLSFFTAVASATVYPYSWRASITLGLVSGLSQAVGTVQLVECFQAAVDAGRIGSVEP